MQNVIRNKSRSWLHRSARLLFLSGTVLLTACNGLVVVGPGAASGPRPVRVAPDGCFEIREPAVRSRVLTRLEPGFRGPRKGQHRVTLREYLHTHRYLVFRCGDVYRVVFMDATYRTQSGYVILRSDGIILSQSF